MLLEKSPDNQHGPRPFNRIGELALVHGAVAGQTAGQNLATLRHEFLQQITLLIINADLIFAKFAIALDGDFTPVGSRRGFVFSISCHS